MKRNIRRADRMVDLTQEFCDTVAPLPSYWSVWYDKQMEDLGLNKFNQTGKNATRTTYTRYVYVLNSNSIRGALQAGVKANKFFNLKVSNLEEARAAWTKMRPQALEWEKMGAELNKADRKNSRVRQGRWGWQPPALLDVQRNQTKSSSSVEDIDNIRNRIKYLLEGVEPVSNPSHDSLMSVLMDAYQQATTGKGNDRHAAGLTDFENQDMMRLMNEYGIDFALGQAGKKMIEGRRLPTGKMITELLGAIIYIAGAVAWLERHAK